MSDIETRPRERKLSFTTLVGAPISVNNTLADDVMAPVHVRAWANSESHNNDAWSELTIIENDQPEIVRTANADAYPDIIQARGTRERARQISRRAHRRMRAALDRARSGWAYFVYSLSQARATTMVFASPRVF
ncbi:hypothetical protein IW148_000405 [Coemansia sp. RSA 1199]|nr:hypothetical protein IW148_000405 [Coemansia sp. RSA 1199]